MADLVANVAYIWQSDDKDSTWETVPLDQLPGRFTFASASDNEWVKRIPELRQELLEHALALDEDAFMEFVENGKFDPAVLKACIRKGTVSGEFVPILCGSSFKNKGVQQMLDAVLDYLPYPGENGGIGMVDPDGKVIGTQEVKDDAPARALAFKVINDQFGTLTFVRVYSGVIKKGDTLANVTRNKKERIGRIVEVQASATKDIDEARAGDIVAFVSMKETETGDSLGDPDKPALLERMRFPDPVISVSVEPKTRADVDKMSTALYKMVKADPSLRLQVDQETGQTVLKGMGELHLEVTIDRMRTELGVEANMGRPRVSFREAFGTSVELVYTHKKQSGGSGQYAEVKMIFEPMPSGTGVEFSDEVVGGRIPREFIPSVEHAVETECKRGQVAGYEVVDFKARLIDGKYHDVDSSALAFEIAGRAAFREAHRNSRPKLLEPIMKIEVVTEGEYLGTIIGDVNRRRGQVTDQGQKGNQATVVGLRAAVRDVRLHQLPALRHERPRHLHDGVRPLLRSAAGPGPEAHGRRGLSPASARQPRRRAAPSARPLAYRLHRQPSLWRRVHGSASRAGATRLGAASSTRPACRSAQSSNTRPRGSRPSSSTAASTRCNGPSTTSVGTTRCRRTSCSPSKGRATSRT